MLAVALATALCLAGAGPVTASAAAASSAPAALWEASLQGRHGTSPDVTVRMIARVSTGGSQIRVRIGNSFGDAPVRVQEAWAGRTIAPGVATLVPGSNQRLRFRGATTVTIPAGG